MRKLLFIIFFLITVGAFSYSNIYDDGNYKMAVFKGWNVLDLNKEYHFEGYSESWDEPYDFIIEQQQILKNKSKYIRGTELKKLFKDNLIPIIISVYAEKYESEYTNTFAISTISSNNFSLKGIKLFGFNEKYNELSKSTGAFYFINVPEKLNYQFFFLIPKELAVSYIRINFEFPINTVIELPADNNEVIKSRIEYLKNEIKRLEEELQSN